MAGILANSVSATMMTGTPDNEVTGYLAAEAVTLSTNPTGATYQWGISRPAGSGTSANISNDTGATPFFVPDVAGYYVVTCTVDSVTTYVIRIFVAAVAQVTAYQAIRMSPVTRAQVPAPPLGESIFHDVDTGALSAKFASGIVVPIVAAPPSIAQAQTAWFIDPVNGLDTNDGKTSSTALKTDAERQRRVGPNWIVNADTTITYLGDIPSSDPCVWRCELGLNGILRISGTPTVTYTSPSGGFTAVTNLNRATQTRSAITESGLGTGRVGQRIRTTSGASSGAIAWLAKDLTGGAYNTSPWGTFNPAGPTLPSNPTNVDVANGNQFVIESLSQIARCSLNAYASAYNGNNTQVLFQNLYFTQSDQIVQQQPQATPSLSIYAHGCRVHGPFNGGALGTSYLDTSPTIITPSSIWLFGCLVIGRISVQQGSFLGVDWDTLFQSSPNNGLRVRFGSVVRIGAMAVFDAAGDAVLCEDGKIRCGAYLSGNDLLWGNANGGFGIRQRAGHVSTYETKPTVTSSVGGNDTSIGGITKAYAAIPFFDGTTSAAGLVSFT